MNLSSLDTGKVPTVLLVEDLYDDVFFFKLALKRAHLPANVHVANDGNEAVEYFSNQGKFSDPILYPLPDVVFLDLKMPNMNGFEVLQWLIDHPLGQPMKVVVLSGSEEPGDRVKARELGAYTYLVKPPRCETLQELFRSLSLSPANVITSA